MAQFIQNILWNSVEGFVEAGKRSAGEYAGNALIKAGDAIENGGRSVGNGIERRATKYGSSLSGQTYQPSPKALPSTARKPAIKRSNSVPASSKPTTGGKSLAGPTSKVPLGAKKYPGGRSANIAGNSINGAKSAVGKPLNGAKSTVAKPSLPKPYPNNVPFGTKITPQSTQKPAQKNSAYPQSKPSGTPVKPGAPKPFSAPSSVNGKPAPAGNIKSKPVDTSKPYPGTSTLPGQASKTPVRRRYTPAPRLGPQVKEGEKMMHIAV
jgi:hypothetical protein